MTIGKRLTALAVLLACLAALTAGGSAESPRTPEAIRFVPVADEAFGEEGRMVIAGTPDGFRLLISGSYTLYIWDVPEGRKIPLVFSREEDQEYLDQLIRQAAVSCSPVYSRLKRDQRAEFEEKTKQQADDYLASRGLSRFESLEQAQECYDHIVPIAGRCAGMGDSFALVECYQLGAEIVTDLRTGESRLIGTDPERRDARFPSVICGDKLFSKDGLLRMGTWDSDYPAENYLFPEYAAFSGETPEIMLSYTAAALLPDDSLLFVSRGMFDSEAGSTPSYLALRSAGESFYIPLGQFPGMNGPDKLLVTENGKYALAWIGGNFYQPAVLAGLETREARETEAGLFFFAAGGNGFLAYDYRDMDNLSVVLLDPETMETRALEVRGDFSEVGRMTIISQIVNNGRGMLFTSSEALRGYFILE